MNLKQIVREILRGQRTETYQSLDKAYLPLDRKHIRRTRNIRLIPGEDNRRGGKYSYAEWAHVIGIFQTLMYLHLPNKESNRILDIGCGTGLLAIASEPFIGKGGKYTGIDVMKRDIDFCRAHYPSANFDFIHFDVANATYAPMQRDIQAAWSIESESVDLTTALSVWTHLNEADAMFYFNEVSRVLKPNGKAIISFFILDDTYRKSLGSRSDQEGRFHMTAQDQWVFDQPAYGSEMWFHPKWVEVPEHAIGVNEAGLEQLMASSGLKLITHHPGNWKEMPGVFFQDVLIFQKA